MKRYLRPLSVLFVCTLLLPTLPALAQAPPTVAIDAIQGVKSLTVEVVSPYAGQTVQTSGVVTAITKAGFFIQTPDASADSNPLTPEGIYVYTGTGKVPVSVAIGNMMQVTGAVATFPALNTQSHTPGAEIEAPSGGTLTITQVSTGNALPAAIALTATNLSSSGSIYQLTPYEGMRVSFSSLTATSGTGGTLAEASETYTSNGQFYAVITGTARPFRAPGIDLRDPAVPNTPSGVAVFDDNPERIFVDSGTLVGSTPINVSTGAVLPTVTGVLDFTDSYDDNYVPARLLIDPTYSGAITPGMTAQAAPVAGANTFTVAAFNVERLYNTNSADDIYYVPAGVLGYNGTSSTGTISTGQTFTSSAVNVTSAAYTGRVAKVALAICTMLNKPDIVALEEVENQSVANDVATQVNSTCSSNYAAYSTDNTTYYTQDGTGISVGFLINTTTVEKLGFTQAGQNETFTPTGATTPITLNDRPWLALQAGIKRANAKDYVVIVIVNHLKALSGENSTTSTSTRQKKEYQAEDIGNAIQKLQAQGQHVISVGDFNAFEFSDGYTDVLGTYTNTNVLPSSQVVQPGMSGLLTPPLDDLVLQLPQDKRWSYDEYGNAQVLDHIVVTPELASGATMAYAHFDADFPVIDYNDATTATRTSDHDVPVGYFTIPSPVLAMLLTAPTGGFGSSPVGTPSAPQVFTLSNPGEAAFTITGITASGDFSETNNCGTTLAINASCTINVVFTPTATGTRTGTLTVATNVNTAANTVPLTGTGTAAAAADFTLADAAGKASTSVTTAAGSNGIATLVFTPVNGFNAAIVSSCVAQGTAPAGVSCTAPATFTLSGTAAVNQTVTFSTTARLRSGGVAAGGIALGSRSPWQAGLMLMLAGLLMFLASRTRHLARRIYRIGGLLALLLAIFLPVVGCGGNGNHSTPPTNGTPAGSYNYTVTATSGTISHAETVTLIVQ